MVWILFLPALMCHTTNMAASCTSVPNIFMRRNRECHEPVERRKNTEIESEANAGTLIKIYVDDARPSAAAGPHRLTTCVLYVGVCVRDQTINDPCHGWRQYCDCYTSNMVFTRCTHKQCQLKWKQCCFLYSGNKLINVNSLHFL